MAGTLSCFFSPAPLCAGVLGTVLLVSRQQSYHMSLPQIFNKIGCFPSWYLSCQHFKCSTKYCFIIQKHRDLYVTTFLMYKIDLQEILTENSAHVSFSGLSEKLVPQSNVWPGLSAPSLLLFSPFSYSSSRCSSSFFSNLFLHLLLLLLLFHLLCFFFFLTEHL